MVCMTDMRYIGPIRPIPACLLRAEINSMWAKILQHMYL